MSQICLGLIERANGELLGYGTVTKTRNLRKDKPDPVAGLSPGAEFGKDCLVGGFLRGEEAVEVVAITHTRCVARYICSTTTLCLAILDCKPSHSLLGESVANRWCVAHLSEMVPVTLVLLKKLLMLLDALIDIGDFLHRWIRNKAKEYLQVPYGQ